jgi:hypothetical protein
MKSFHFSVIAISIFLFTASFAQDKNEKESIEKVATNFLNSMANQLKVSSDLLSTESLDKVKEMYLSMALNYDSTGTTNAMMLLPANKIKSMSSAEVWDHMNKISDTMEKLEMNIEWSIINTEIKNDVAFVTYDVKNREQKVMQLKKENNSWKVVLGLSSIF